MTAPAAFWLCGGLLFFCGLLPFVAATARRAARPRFVGRTMLVGATLLVLSAAIRSGAALHADDRVEATGAALDGAALIVIAYAGFVAYRRVTRENAR